MPRIMDEDGYETDTFECDCGCGTMFPITEADDDILKTDGLYIAEDCAPDYIEEVTYDVAREERFYV